MGTGHGGFRKRKAKDSIWGTKEKCPEGELPEAGVSSVPDLLWVLTAVIAEAAPVTSF